MSAYSRPVYSSEAGRLCPGCGKPPAACACRKPGAPPGDGQVRVRRETGGRGGKTVTTVRGLPLAEAELQQLGKQLKAACGSGGTVKDGVLEVQGDHVERALAWLLAKGFKAKRAGG
ncbi:translation initiation factor Sui1 [Pseudorhodoferax sp.]|uniref:translation initiation factor Sui1 n=1 Tax=Pseudorhodoferax sp. TaxID=1993553 RepID=UPI001B56484D|nr:translation initiation factor Sui1 [Pseudorhodoferax sp.]MBP8145511.1 translation initiation factor Sui1 [Inhella sp.]